VIYGTTYDRYIYIYIYKENSQQTCLCGARPNKYYTLRGCTAGEQRG